MVHRCGIVHRYGGAWEIWWCMGDVVSMKEVVIRGRCGGVRVVGRCMKAVSGNMGDAVVHGRCCGA